MEKPFLCSHMECKMTFTNEDHLEVHKRCHEIEMSHHCNNNHNPTSIITKLPTFVIDQTPTPTNCLKLCEDVSLFHDITLNPFDEEFRKASQFKTQLSIPENSTADSLETPKILPLVDSDETISSTSKDVSSCSETYSNSMSYVHSNSKNIARIQHPTIGENTRTPKIRLNINVAPTSESQASPKLISTPTPVITAGPSVSHGLVSSESCPIPEDLSEHYTSSSALTEISYEQTLPDTKMSVVPSTKIDLSQYTGASVQCSGIVRSDSPKKGTSSSQYHTNVPVPSSPATVLQLVLRLPNGRSIPVEIPATPVVSSSGLNNGVVTVAQSNNISSENDVPSPSSGNSGTSVAKQKLKQALESTNTAAKPGVTQFSRANTADRIAEMTRCQTSNENIYELAQNMLNDLGDSKTTSPSGCHSKRRRNSDEDDPLEKRYKFLERNRVAAVRCREKKKQFVKNLFVKSDELEGINQKLQSEVCTLRSEVALLKSLLLQHKDCPVTLAMQSGNSSENSFPKSFTTFKIEQPSGVITQVTTTPVANFSPQSQPDDTLDDPAQTNAVSLSQSNILVSPYKVGLKTDSAIPGPIAMPIAGTSKIQCPTSNSVVVGGNIVLPETFCLPSAVSSPSAVILLNHNTVSSVSATHVVGSGSKQAFIVPKTTVPTRRVDTNSFSITPNTSSSTISPQRIVSINTSTRDVFNLNQLKPAKKS